ncbi:MAG: TolC family protein, partial [Planctomycetota bacterium]
ALGVVADRVEAGVSSELDLRLLRSERSTAEANRERRRTELAREVRSFEILIGRYPKGTLSSGSELPELSKEIPGGIPAQLLGRRPDIAVAERDLAAADARVYAAKASLLPRISLTASGGTSSDELADLLSGDFLVWQLAANVLQPVFEGGKLLAQVDESQATRDEALELYANTVLQAFAEVETALAVERFLAAEEEKTKRSVDDAQEAVRLSETRYGEGVESLLFVLESRRSLVASASRWVEVRLERLKNRVDLYLALGGGYGAEAARKDVAESPADSPEPKTSPKTVIEG